MNLNWNSEKSELLLPLHWENKLTLSDLPNLSGHVWLSTSGSSMAPKLVALSKQALLNSAKSVNQWLQVTAQDVWVNVLPCYHVGGLSVGARAFIGNNAVYEFSGKWDPQRFKVHLQNHKATLTSIVPTQLFDLVKANIRTSKYLRAVFVGGGHLSKELYFAARALGWPVLITYGLSEAGSQVATNSLQSLQEDTYPQLEILPHVEVQADQEGCLAIKGTSLFSQYAVMKGGGYVSIDPKQNGWFQTDDLGTVVNNKFLQMNGRRGDAVKIAGHLVNLTRQQELWESVTNDSQSVIVATPDVRLQNQLVLVSSGKLLEVCALVEKYNERAGGSEKVRAVYQVHSVPRSELGKVKKQEVMGLLGF